MLEVALAMCLEPEEEHLLILKAKTRGNDAAWELGGRLARFHESGQWRGVIAASGGVPFESFSDYVERGVRISRNTAYRYMEGASFPVAAARRFGIWKMAWLRRLLDLLGKELPLEEALALELPVRKGGSPTRFAEMTIDEAEAAYTLLRDAGEKPGRASGRPPGATKAAKTLQKSAAGAVAEWLKPKQIKTRETRGVLLIDVSGVPLESAPEVYEALARKLREERDARAE